MTLYDIVAQGNYPSASDAYTAITTDNVEVRDDQLYTWAGVALVVGPQNAEALRLALDANGMGWAVHQLGGSGLQLSNELVQTALLAFASSGVPGCGQLAAVGIHYVTPYEQAELPQPTQQDVTLVWNQWKTDSDLAAQKLDLQTRFDAILNQVGTVEQPQAVIELRAIADELEA